MSLCASLAGNHFLEKMLKYGCALSSYGRLDSSGEGILYQLQTFRSPGVGIGRSHDHKARGLLARVVAYKLLKRKVGESTWGTCSGKASSENPNVC